jgi:hypothetical protein
VLVAEGARKVRGFLDVVAWSRRLVVLLKQEYFLVTSAFHKPQLVCCFQPARKSFMLELYASVILARYAVVRSGPTKTLVLFAVTKGWVFVNSVSLRRYWYLVTL